MASTEPINPRSRVRGHYRRWARRWGVVIADSFNRVNADDLGVTDTGHDWGMFNPSAVLYPWSIRSGKARLRADPGASYCIPRIPSGLADARVRVQITMGVPVLFGPGLSLRWNPVTDAGVLLYYQAAGGTTYRCSTYSGGILTTQFDLTGPVWAAGETKLFEVTMLGNDYELFLDKVSIGTGSEALHNDQSIHGLFAWRETDTLFDNYQVLRKT